MKQKMDANTSSLGVVQWSYRRDWKKTKNFYSISF
jgi:hypothetical protein